MLSHVTLSIRRQDSQTSPAIPAVTPRPAGSQGSGPGLHSGANCKVCLAALGTCSLDRREMEEADQS